MSYQPNHIYEFGPFRLEGAERLLLRNGETIPLQPKAFDLLLVLVQRHGHLLEKDVLLKAVWPDTVVEEVNLANNISILRKALSENGRQFIETVPRRGYRFVAPVREQAVASGVGADDSIPVMAEAIERQDAPSSEPSVWRLSRWVRRRPGFAALLLILLLIGFVSAFGYQWRTRWSKPTASNVAIRSIAVLPFKPLVADSQDEALQMGMADTLIFKLSGLKQLNVRSINSVRKYINPDQDPLAAGREQKVDFVLDSIVQRDGEMIRVSTRLLNVADETTVWKYQCDEQYCANLFVMQDTISQKVAAALSLHLTAAEQERLRKHFTENKEALKLYFRGRHLVHTRRVPDIENAIPYFEQAIALDHDFALAYVMLGFSYASLAMVGHSPPKEAWPKAKAAYDQALKLDDQLAEAHSQLGNYKTMFEWDYNGAEQEYRRALELDPNSADSRHFYAGYLVWMGRFEEAISEIRRAENLDPTDFFISRDVAQVLYFARRYPETIEQSLRVDKLYPNSVPVYDWMINAYERMGDEQGAFAAQLMKLEANRAGPDEITGMKAAFARGGLKGCLRRELDRLLEQEKSGYVVQYRVAKLYARLGEKEQALARLQKAVDDRNGYVISLKVEPLWDSYRADPRFVKLVRDARLEP
jgi:DNA-binding winged helix-turn-helix (wHTH) protein/TolB-like protein